MIVHHVKYERGGRLLRLSAEAQVESLRGTTLEPWFDFSHEVGTVETTGDVFAAGLLAPCMLQGEDLRIEAPVSAQLLAGIDEIQAILCAWYPQLTRIKVHAAQTIVHANQADATGCFFSAGVDAWYSLCKHQEQVNDLIVVRGFDIPVDGKHEIWKQTCDHVHEIGKALGKRVIEVQTNIRAVGDMRHGKAGWGNKAWSGDFWGECMHGSSLAAVALAMQSILKRIFIGATYSYDYMAPWGSHPLLDHHWSSESMDVRHDGAEADRMQKIRRIAEYPLALATLRVCYENLDRRYNCCTCEKCCRTMLALRACGKLHEASAFPHQLDLKKVRGRVYDGHELPWYRAIIPDAQQARDSELLEALQTVVGDRFSIDQALAKVKHRLRSGVPALQPLLNLLSRDRRKEAKTSIMTEHPGTA